MSNHKKFQKNPNISDERVNRASASEAVDSGLIPNVIRPMTLRVVFTAFLLDIQH